MPKIDGYLKEASRRVDDFGRLYSKVALHSAAYSTSRGNGKDYGEAYNHYRQMLMDSEHSKESEDLRNRLYRTAFSDLAVTPIAALQLYGFWKWMLNKKERMSPNLIFAGQLLEVMLGYYGLEGQYNRYEFRMKNDMKSDAIAAFSRPLALMLGQYALSVMSIDRATGRPLYEKKSDKIKNFVGASLFTLTQIAQIIPWNLIAYGSHLSEEERKKNMNNNNGQKTN